ncbi:hypothetical protein, partial [Staphylococcus epidermidis]
MQHKNKFQRINQIIQVIGFLSFLAILTIITLNFFIKGHLQGHFEIGFNIQSNQVYVVTTLIIVTIICTI